ncbi:MAG: heavy metal translocating P-type ATPase [Clostridiaceae bacterium]|nr:heavy metal translocating P-type ATPase [Clostridia bacterium]MDY3871419.1 heavy metal translocating P-type ATPase [Clostridiaceae bacterium]
MTKKQKRMLYRILGAAALFLALKLLDPAWPLSLLWLAPYLLAGYDILLGAVHGIRSRDPFDENFLMAVATVGAVALGNFQEAVAVMVFYQTGELFQSYAVGKSRRSIAALMDIRPDSATLETPEGEQAVPPDEVAPGSVILVRPGERVPLDGVVLEGASSLDTASLTGESLPREVGAGCEVLSGCVNLTGLLRVRTTKPFGESTVSRILDLVENSAMKKSRSEAFITRFARVYTPAVCLAALVLALVPPLGSLALGSAPRWGMWVYRALSFLVISCPCALVISIPLSFFGGIGGASAKGILVKGGTDLEALSKAGTVVFDKTGTLTRGVFQVSQVRPETGVQASRLLELAALTESYSNHPISRSLRESWGGDPAGHAVEEVREIPGRGVSARVDGLSVSAGNGKLMAGLGLDAGAAEGTAVHVAAEGAYLGCILLADLPKDGAKEALEGLKRQGVSRTVMLTGDSEQAAAPVARALGLDGFFAGLLPQDKVERVEQLLESKPGGTTLCFVGDGVNDAPVLSRADVGVAMGAMGSDAAIEAADVVLMDDDPRKLPLAMAIAKKTVSIVRQNIVFALAVKAACLVLTALGRTNMWWAIFADVGVMVLAVLNATRALRAPRV